MGTITIKPAIGCQLEEGWVSVDFSNAQREEERIERGQAQARAIYSRVFQPLAFVVCANAPSVSSAVLGIAAWTFLKPSVIRATACCTGIWKKNVGE